jgi:hypothetical protein
LRVKEGVILFHHGSPLKTMDVSPGSVRHLKFPAKYHKINAYFESSDSLEQPVPLIAQNKISTLMIVLMKRCLFL